MAFDYKMSLGKKLKSLYCRIIVDISLKQKTCFFKSSTFTLTIVHHCLSPRTTQFKFTSLSRYVANIKLKIPNQVITICDHSNNQANRLLFLQRRSHLPEQIYPTKKHCQAQALCFIM